MKIAVLFDGAGLARLGLEQAGHECTGFELAPEKHLLSLTVGSGNSVLADARDVNLDGYDAVWASPPCQMHSGANMTGRAAKEHLSDAALLQWALQIKTPILWVENVVNKTISWGTLYNAAQFLEVPVQQRRRIIGGNYLHPVVHRAFQYSYPALHIPPAVTASEWKLTLRKESREDWWNVRRKFTRWYKRYYHRLPTLYDAAHAQGFVIPEAWNTIPDGFTPRQWAINKWEAIGNGVPVYMARAFGEMYK